MYTYMQGSDIGFLPISQLIPACDTQSKVISRLEYHIYRQCISYNNLGENLLFDAVQDMLNPLTSSKVGISIAYCWESAFLRAALQCTCNLIYIYLVSSYSLYVVHCM